MKAYHTDHGLQVGPAAVDVLYTDDERGAWLVVRTEHAAVEIRITPKGRKVTASHSHMRIQRDEV